MTVASEAYADSQGDIEGWIQVTVNEGNGFRYNFSVNVTDTIYSLILKHCKEIYHQETTGGV